MHILPKFWAYSGPFRSSNITKHKVKYSNNHLKLFPGDTYKSILIKGSKTWIFVYFAYFSAIFGLIPGKPDHFQPFNTRADEEEQNTNNLKSFPTQTNESILMKVSKILIFKYFAYFSAIFGKFSGRSGPFSSSNTTRNKVEHYTNHLERFSGEKSKSTLI